LKPRLSLRNVNLGLVLLLILAMTNQLGFGVRLGGTALPVTAADVVLVLAAVGIGLRLVSRGMRKLKLPPLQAFVLVAAAAAALARAGAGLGAAKDLLQFIEYFLLAFAVFLNVEECSDIKPYVTAFAVSTGLVVAWGIVHYVVAESPLDIRAGYANRNGLSAFLALALPFLYGIALHARHWRVRIALLAIVAGGLLVCLAGGSLLAIVLVLVVLSAVRGQRALVPCLLVLAIAIPAASRWLRPYHTDALFSSVALTVEDNYLLSDRQLFERAQELYKPTHKIVADHSGELIMPQPRPLDADRLLTLLGRRRDLTRREIQLLSEVKTTIENDVPSEVAASYPLRGPRTAVRYERWNAAIVAARALWFPRSLQPSDQHGDPFFGYGPRPYHHLLKPFMPGRLQYRTDEPEVFNVAAPEDLTHNVWLKALVQMGLVGLAALAWLVAALVGRAIRLYAAAHSELMLGVALGAAGAIVGFALAGLFTENLIRGLAIPFVFVCATVAIAERIVHGDDKSALEKLTRYD